MLKKMVQKNWVILSLGLFYLLLFMPVIKGVGNFWDWNLPYFNYGLKNVLLNFSNSWVNHDLGGPLKYASDIYLRVIFYLASYTGLQTETIYYFFIVFLFSLGSYGVFLITKRYSPVWLSLILSISALLNPAVFYKLVAGHTGYLVGFLVFIYLFYYLIAKYRSNFRSTLITGLLVGLAAVQIQFYIISMILLIAYFIFYKGSFRARYFITILAISLLINLPWLSNFLLGANNVSNFSSFAASNAFNDSSMSTFFNIFILSFSKATLIKYYFSKIMFGFFGLFFIVLMFYIYYSRKPKSKDFSLYFLLLVVFIFLNSGLFAKFNIYPLSVIFPMFREVGHFSPLVMLFAICLLGSLYHANNKLNKIIVGFISIFIIINSYVFIKHIPKIDYASVRHSFAEFESIKQEDDPTTYRILTYPFFSQYSYLSKKSTYIRGFLADNSGYDNYTLFSGYDSVNQYIQGFDESLQYNFLQSRDVKMLEKYGVKYIFDYSGIYESNYERYTTPEVYHNDVSLIKNRVGFLDAVENDNPGRVQRVSPNILKLLYAEPKVLSTDVEYKQISPAQYKISVKNLQNITSIKLLTSYHPMWRLYPDLDRNDRNWQNLSGAVSISTNFHSEDSVFGNVWQLDAEDIKNKWGSNYYQANPDGTINIELTAYFYPQRFFVLSVFLSLIIIVSSTLFLLASGYSGRPKR